MGRRRFRRRPGRYDAILRKCKDCGIEIENRFDVRCSKCKKKNTVKRKYKRRHEHRKKLAGR